MDERGRLRLACCLTLLFVMAASAHAQVSPAGPAPSVGLAVKAVSRNAGEPLALKTAPLSSDLRIDGILDEQAWAQAEAIQDLTMIEPVQGGRPTGRTRVRVLANARGIVFGVECDDPNPRGIVSYTKQRDGEMSSEDHIEIVLDPFLDGRSGYVFWVNPLWRPVRRPHQPRERRHEQQLGRHLGSRHERTDNGWTAEIRIPIQTLSFKQGRDHLALQRPAPNPTAAGNRALGEPAARLQDHASEPGRDCSPTCRSSTSASVCACAPRSSVGGGVPPPNAAFENDTPRQPRRDAAARSRTSWRLASDQHRLRGDGGGHAADEPHPLRAVLPGETHVLPGGRRHLPVRARARNAMSSRSSAVASASWTVSRCRSWRRER